MGPDQCPRLCQPDAVLPRLREDVLMSESDQPTTPESTDESKEPTTKEMKEPSTEKEPGEEPKAPPHSEEEPSHEAVGIGIIGRPQTEMEEADDDAE